MHPVAPISDPDEETALLLDNGQQTIGKQSIYIYLVSAISAIGGFLFGYDTGIISGAMLYMKEYFNLSEWWQEAVVSSTLLTAWLFSILSGSCTDKFGRKPVIIASSIIFIVGSVVLALANSKVVLLAGRLIVGGGVGFASMTSPMYIAELAPATIRGKLLLINMCCITGGQSVASVIAYLFSIVSPADGWRYMLGFAAIPAVIQLLAFAAMPESPRWLVTNKRFDQAYKVLRKIRPKGADIDAEFSAICATYAKAKHEKDQLLSSIDLANNNNNNNNNNYVETSTNLGPSTNPQRRELSIFRRILANESCRKALVVGCLLQLVQQASGINTVMYYSATIIEMAGVYSKQEALLLSAGTALVNFVFTILGYVLVERAGRRKLVLFSLAGVFFSLLVLAAGFQFADWHSQKVTIHDLSDKNLPCSQYSDCSTCTTNDFCGFCFNGTSSKNSCYRVNETSKDSSQLGNCNFSSQQDGNNNFVWAYEWCPSEYSWLIVVGMVSYLLFFAPGMGPMPWTINSEIYPSWARSWCLSMTTSVNWLFNLLISMTFLSLTRAVTKQGAFYIYASVALVGFIYFNVVLPETRGKSLEELETLFAPKSRKRSVDSSKVMCI